MELSLKPKLISQWPCTKSKFWLYSLSHLSSTCSRVYSSFFFLELMFLSKFETRHLYLKCEIFCLFSMCVAKLDAWLLSLKAMVCISVWFVLKPVASFPLNRLIQRSFTVEATWRSLHQTLVLDTIWRPGRESELAKVTYQVHGRIGDRAKHSESRVIVHSTTLLYPNSETFTFYEEGNNPCPACLS